jgi:acyl-coenzyme A synthetase/AMP-(fatty) acid ligase
MIKSLPFSNARQEFPAEGIVAYGLDGCPITWEYVLTRQEFWRSQIRDHSAKKIAVFHNDSVEFLCIIFCLWQMDKIPVIPSNTLASTIRMVQAETDCFIGEFPDEAPAVAEETHASCDSNRTEKSAESTALIMFTSGSTGDPAAISKTFSQLNAELRLLEQHFGSLIGGAVILGTVSHHHMYGLPFRLLWPVVSGRAFLRCELNYLEQLIPLCRLDIALVSSPAHLEHIPETMGWVELKDRIHAVFSAGAPLSLQAAINCHEKMGVSITEIYGSTETGAVAFRSQETDPMWMPFQSISIKEIDGKLAINSPTKQKDSWFLTEDYCLLQGVGQFSLQGRADKLMKVGGKRISITAIEFLLEKHSWVDKARVTLLPDRKARVGAVIQLSAEGNARLVDQGKRIISQKLIDILKDDIERVAWPRYWRFVAEIPINQQGKTTTAELERLFDERNKSRLPLVVKVEEGDSAAVRMLHLRVPTDLLYLEGHFPGRPILPGVVQVSWVIHYGSEIFGDLGEFLRLDALKFQQVIQPEEIIQLHLKWDAEKRKLIFSYTCAKNSCSSGRIAFGKVA